MKQFPKSDCKYGAPMGRAPYGTPSFPVRLVRVNIDRGGYDDGGAYWGHGQPIYMATGEDYQAFTRANTRSEAARELGIEDLLRRKIQPSHNLNQRKSASYTTREQHTCVRHL